MTSCSDTKAMALACAMENDGWGRFLASPFSGRLGTATLLFPSVNTCEHCRGPGPLLGSGAPRRVLPDGAHSPVEDTDRSAGHCKAPG